VASRVGLAVPQALHAAPHDPYRPARVDARLEDRRTRDDQVGPWIGLGLELGLGLGSGLGLGLGSGLGLGLGSGLGLGLGVGLGLGLEG